MADADDADLRVLEGCALPPQVDGAPRGAVLLSVPHVLPSATTDAAAARSAGVDGGADGGGLRVPRLPAAPLVRVRWWGEDRPGSTLFRPTRIAHEQDDDARADDQEDDSEDDDDDDAGDSSIRMRYPVRVPLEQLLEYLRDMHELVFDVVDRATRKKVGRSVLSFQFDGGATDAEQAAASLRRVNALCEIQSTVDAAVVLGYLTVNFEIEWPPTSEVSTPLKWANTMGVAPSVSVNPRQTIGIPGRETERSVQQRLSFSSISSSSTLSGFQRQPPWRRAGGEATTTAPTNVSNSDTRLPGASVRLEGLLEKGRALERSMSKAVKDEAAVSTPTHLVVDTTEAAPSPVSMAMLMAPYEAMTEELDTSWERVLEEAEKIQGSSPKGRTVPVQDAVKSMRQELGAIGVSLGGHNALEISFESMELEQEMMDRLRQLREGSVSTRFSPIQLVVSHEHPSHLLNPSTSSDRDRWIAAFAVNSSLRKRHWRTNYTHTLPLVADGSSQANAGTQDAQVNQRLLKFRVRCKPQHASPPGSRRRGRPTQVCDLSTSVSVKELLDHRDRPWVLSLPLRIEEDVSRSTNDRRVAKRALAVGTITVKFRFCSLPGATDEQNDQQSDDAESSAWSLDDQDHQYFTPHSVSTRNLAAPSNQRGDSPHRSGQRGVGIPLFFGLLIGRAMVTRESDPQTKSGNGHQVVPKLSVRFDYGTPAFFGRSAKALRLKRSAKASLRAVGKDCLKANVSHMNAFPLDVSDEFVEKLHHGMLILEAWIQERPTALKSYVNEKLVGVVKIPLHVFASCTRDRDAITSCLEHAIPHIGVDQDFPIVDPLDDQVNGQVHVRMAFGSAEQMFNLKSSLAAVIKLQTLVRGWLARRAIAYWKRFELAGFEDVDTEAEIITRDSEQLTDDVRDRSTSNVIGQSESDLSVPSVTRGDTRESLVSGRVSRIEIRVEVRQSYRKMVQVSTPVIGCEVHGQLRFNDERDGQSGPSASGPRFTLWWDANEAQLNSYFIHTLQASSSSTGIELQDVLLLFRIEPHLTTAAKAIHDDSVGSVKGGAGIDLGSVIAEDGSGFESIDQLPVAGDFVEDIDLPIEWGLSGTEAQKRGLVETLPLRITVRITRDDAQDGDTRALKGITEMMEAKSYVLEDPSEDVAAIQTVSRTERLLPASLHLNLDIQRISELRDIIQEQLAAATLRPDSDRVVKSLRRAINRGSLTMTIVMSLCLGVELHPEEHNRNNGDVLFQDDQKQWYKRFRFEHIQLDLVNGVQALPSFTQGAVHVIVHPELVAFLQAGSLDAQFLVCDDDGDVPVGTVSVPVSAILFRPSGVQGSFPVRVDNGLAGRVGVHLCIDQDETPDRSPSSSSARRYPDKVARQRIEHPPVPQDSTGVTVAEERGVRGSEEQTLEQAVASIHEAAQQIQNRLARLTTHSSQSEIDGQGDDPTVVSISPIEEASLKLSTSEVSSSATSSAQQSPRARYQRFIHDEEETHIEDLQLQDSDVSEGVRSEKVAASDAADDLDGFRPITLASFGIEEMELSPIIEADSPTFRGEEERVQPSNDTDFGRSEDFQGVEEPAYTSEDSLPVDAEELTDASESDRHHFVEDLADRSEDGSHDYSEQVPDTSKSERHEHVESLPDLGEDESRAHIEELADMIEDRHEPTNQDGEVATSRDCGTLPAESEDAKAVGVVISSSEPVSHSPVRAYAPNEQRASTEYASRNMGQGGQNGFAAGDTGSVTVESTVATDSSETCEADATGDSTVAEQRMSDDECTCAVEADHSFVSSVTPHNKGTIENCVDLSGSGDDEAPGVDALQSASGNDQDEEYIGEVSNVDIDETLGDKAEEGLEAQHVHPQQLSIALCESSTQTEGEDRAESVTSNAQIPPVRADEKTVTVDICCQTEPDSKYEVGDSDVQPTLPLDEPAADNATDSQTQGCHEGSSEIRNSSPHALMDAVGTNSVQVTDICQVLPADKFKIAWQLLNEIRALYVDPSTQDQSAVASLTSEETENAALRAQDLVVNQDSSSVNPAQPETFASVAQEQEYVSSRYVESIHEQHETATREDSAPITASASAWHWRDAHSLKAEVEERLGASKREYEEALALSQSIQSMKSWSTSSHVSTKREMTAEWEEKARELSASALAKRQHSARTHTFFRVDTETERIARIMQGSMQYWLHEDDDEGDGCETSDDDAELVDNFF